MKLAKTLQNPIALVVQGFVVGSILVLAPNPLSAAAPAATGGEAVVAGAAL